MRCVCGSLRISRGGAEDVNGGAVGEASGQHRYEGRGGVVRFDVKRCIHAAECVRRLPAVFDSKAKPWVNADAADADAIASTVERCPSGALQFVRRDGRTEPPPANCTATLTTNGATYLRGDITLVLADGIARAETRMALCRCGTSRNKPYCDGSHKESGFLEAGVLPANAVPGIAGAGGKLTVTPRRNGCIQCVGALTIEGADRRSTSTDEAFLCRCGASGNKPWCDGTHKKIGFAA
jgi:CDGSH-type Zn-finger protein/uncharacterized Fe-S cluster protein YjdI